MTGFDYENASPGGAYSYLFPRVLGLIRRYFQAPLNILDFGCGNGSFANQLSHHYPDIVGFDVSKSGIEHAKTAFPHLEFHELDVYDNRLPFKVGNDFNLVLIIEVLEHLYDPGTCLKRAYECLVPGGGIIVSTPYHGYLKNVAIALTGRFDGHVQPLSLGGHIKFFSFETMSQLMTDERFAVIHKSGTGRVPYFWKSMLMVGRKG